MSPERIKIGAETETRVITGRGSVRFVRKDASGKITESESAGKSRPGETIATLGLVDLQVNGFAGVDFNRDDLTGEDLDRALTAMLSSGTTRCLPTVITSSVENMAARLRSIDKAISQSRLGPWMVAGFHVEGPFLSPEDGYAGCHPKEHMLPADMAVFDRIVGDLSMPVRLVTVAPERGGVLNFISEVKKRGIAVALGHTNATADQIAAAAEAGASLSTHLGNGVSHSLEKNQNPLFAQLSEDRLSASFIADGVHIPPRLLKIYLRAKEFDRSLLVTDATAGAVAEPGLYTLGDVPIERCADGVVREPGSRYLGGSSATMESMARNLIRWFGMGLEEIVDLARTHPLRLIGENSIPEPGDTAELLWWKDSGDGPRIAAAQVGPHHVGLEPADDKALA
ncbi:MAG: N-acetylglucosamine-6-phosphate deacetylase [Rhodospirillales bacterium]|nr:N-acetylglucosamine-6-phosphate deacetylase [Rhodospirillales bacterium]